MNKNKIINILVIFSLISVLLSPLIVFSIESNETEKQEEQLEIEDDEENKIKKETKDGNQTSTKKINISYTTHVQNIGWQKYVTDGTMAGTSGKSLRLEAIKIKLENQDYSGDIEYRTHIQNIGWEKEFKKNNELSGTSGQSLRLEAIEIKLTGELAEHYDIYYRVHAQNFGWLDWAKNGESAGTAGYAYRLEAIEITIVEKEGTSPGKTDKPFIRKYITYSTHIQNIGWENPSKYDGETSGTSGKSLRLEAIKIKLDNQDYEGNVEYRSYVQNIGWQNYVKNGAISGTSGQSLRLEAIEIRLTGELSNHYDIYYRIHAQNLGWLDWAKNGAPAGTAGYAYRLEAIEIKLVEKEGTSPGKTENPFVQRYVRYSAYQNNWLSSVYDGKAIGTIGKPIESIRINEIKGEYSGYISYATYLSDIGWQNYTSNENSSNKVGNKIEAIRVKLNGEMANYYDIYYSVYISNIGWTGWAKNGEDCGYIGNYNNIQSLKIEMVKKGEKAPGDIDNSYKEEELKAIYSSYVTGSKWQNYVTNGELSGTTGKSKNIQGIKIKLNKKTLSGSISYRTHVSYVGWQNYVTENVEAGKIGNNIEAIKIKLTGDIANQYDVYYRVHVSNVGWMGWTSNDNPAGTSESGLGIEAVEIKILKKGSTPPENLADSATTEAFLSAHWETESDGNKYFYDIFGNKVTSGSYTIGTSTYYFGPTGIYLGTKNLEILDISSHNGTVDWKNVASSGIYGVILRVAASSVYRDSKLKENVTGCKKYGIPYGIYIYSYAENYTEGIEYANFTKSLIKEFDMNPTLGIFLDLESNNVTKFMGVTEYTAVVKGFLSVIPNAEVYTYTNYANTALNTSYIRKKITWIADYRGYVGYTGSYRMWQYTSTGKNAGVNGDVDRSTLYSLN